MDTRQKFGLLVIALVLTIVVIFAGRAFLIGYRPVEGRVLEKVYTPGSSNVDVSQVTINGKPGMEIRTHVELDKYILLIDVNGEVSSYSVTAVTYARVQPGGSIWMNCNAYTCGVIEE